VHGSDVLVVNAQGDAGTEDTSRIFEPPHLEEADALVAREQGFCLAVLTADCAAVALASPEGLYGAVHVGWRGLLDGVVQRSLAVMRDLGATTLWAGIGPCIHPCCYAFDDPALDVLADRYGARARATTTQGVRALDLPYALRAALRRGGARLVAELDRCTSCGADCFSHRARGDEKRQALLVWSQAAAS
jgi:polyphenol oxidase